MPTIDSLLRPDIAALEAYTPVAPIEVLAAQLGLPIERIVKLDANESPYGPSPRAAAALAALGGALGTPTVGQFLEPLPAGRYRVELAVAQDGYDWEAPGGPSATFTLEVAG